MVWKWGEKEEDVQVRRRKGKKGGKGIREDREEMREKERGCKRKGRGGEGCEQGSARKAFLSQELSTIVWLQPLSADKRESQIILELDGRNYGCLTSVRRRGRK